MFFTILTIAVFIGIVFIAITRVILIKELMQIEELMIMNLNRVKIVKGGKQ